MITCNPEDILTKYQNGNLRVTILKDGTKIREYPQGELPYPEFPESIDLKITNYCVNGCKYCHERSNPQGRAASVEEILTAIDGLPKGVEVAIGGGDPLSHPYLSTILYEFYKRGFISNITIHQTQVGSLIFSSIISPAVYHGVGVSVVDPDSMHYISELTSDYVMHLIVGVNKVQDLITLHEKGFRKFLLLGYKTFGRGMDYRLNHNQEIETNIRDWKVSLSKLIHLSSDTVISFDNLSIEQLNPKRLFIDQLDWDKFYMGDEFTYSMYVDAVGGTYVPTSRSVDRTPISEMSILEYFKTYRGSKV